MATAKNQTDAADAQKSGTSRTIAFVIAGLALLVMGVIAGPFVVNAISPPDPDAAKASTSAPESKSRPIYQSLHPPLVVNFNDEYGDSHFMQITMEVMSRDQSVINAVRDNLAVIRNALILLYSGSIYEDVITREGKEVMLEEGLAEIERVIVETTGEGGVEALYFTELLIQ